MALKGSADNADDSVLEQCSTDGRHARLIATTFA
jgi:hypothetical protein